MVNPPAEYDNVPAAAPEIPNVNPLAEPETFKNPLVNVKVPLTVALVVAFQVVPEKVTPAGLLLFIVMLLKLAVAAAKFLNVPAPLKVCAFVEGEVKELKK